MCVRVVGNQLDPAQLAPELPRIEHTPIMPAPTAAPVSPAVDDSAVFSVGTSDTVLVRSVIITVISCLFVALGIRVVKAMLSKTSVLSYGPLFRVIELIGSVSGFMFAASLAVGEVVYVKVAKNDAVIALGSDGLTDYDYMELSVWAGGILTLSSIIFAFGGAFASLSAQGDSILETIKTAGQKLFEKMNFTSDYAIFLLTAFVWVNEMRSWNMSMYSTLASSFGICIGAVLLVIGVYYVIARFGCVSIKKMTADDVNKDIEEEVSSMLFATAAMYLIALGVQLAYFHQWTKIIEASQDDQLRYQLGGPLSAVVSMSFHLTVKMLKGSCNMRGFEPLESS